MRYKPELDGIRGIAIVGVLLTHCYSYVQQTPLSKPLLTLMAFGGWGVDLFFALSGFLITGILLETKPASNYLSSFYARRFLRIFPVYYAVLAVLFASACLSHWAAANMPVKTEWPSYLLYLQNVPWFWTNGFVNGHMMSHFWSLAVEEQFYLVWPFVILVLPEWALFWVCGVLFTVALPLRLFLVQHVFGSSWAEMIVTTSRMDGLFVGAACALVIRKFRIFPLSLCVAWGIAGISMLSWILLFHRRSEALNSGLYIRTYGVTAVALIAGSLIGLSQRRVRPLDWLFNARWLRFLGIYSYGIYVFHVPIYDVASRLIAPKLGVRLPLPLGGAALFILLINAVSIGLAVISFRYFESRLLRLKTKFAPTYRKRTDAGSDVGWNDGRIISFDNA